MQILTLLATLLPHVRKWDSTISYNDGQWTTTTPAYYPPTTYSPPTTTTSDTWWTPTPTTSYYYSYSTYYTYSTSTTCITYNPTYIVTITSLIPCPVTIYTTQYVCDACEQPTTPVCNECDAYTSTSYVYATTTPTPVTTNAQIVTLSSYTSNSLVYVVVSTVYDGFTTTTTTPAPATAASNVQVIYANEAGGVGLGKGFISSITCAALGGLLLLVL